MCQIWNQAAISNETENNGIDEQSTNTSSHKALSKALLRMKFTILRLIAGSPASRSPLAASSEDEKSSSPESPPAQGLLARYLPSVFSFRRSSDSDVDCADSTSASGSTEGTDGCTNTGGNATAERRASSRASNRPSSRSVRFTLPKKGEHREFPKAEPGVADTRWWLDESLGDLPKKSAEMSPPSRGIIKKATSSSCREPLGSGYFIVGGRIRRYSHRLQQKALKEASKSI
ncbi:predicted protein [Chaetoceros tenuissimus]|uniref:Uncharacterized protein n=2 Tax=Chaetoceros tenuissimus TaxID=426638 RepID=A0AAD3GYR1_9STRA|nr:predicted protein [Chaetoceros tenuissimus]GFH57802.1 predicted protein [Chaetoceros tenuissimus]